MARHIQAYFNTEDQVEGARITLRAYNTNAVEAGNVSNEWGEDDEFQVTLLPLNNGVIRCKQPGSCPCTRYVSRRAERAARGSFGRRRYRRYVRW